MNEPLSHHDKDMLMTLGIGMLGILLIALVGSEPFQSIGMCIVALGTTAVLFFSDR